jgi:hypothetical protein
MKWPFDPQMKNVISFYLILVLLWSLNVTSINWEANLQWASLPSMREYPKTQYPCQLPQPYLQQCSPHQSKKGLPPLFPAEKAVSAPPKKYAIKMHLESIKLQ